MKRLILTVFALSTSLASAANIYITVSGANVKRAKLAVGQVHALAAPADPLLAKRIRDQVMSDLELVNLFDFIPEASFASHDPAKEIASADYEAFSGLQASFALKMGYKLNQGRLSLEVNFFDIPGKKKIFGTRYQYPVGNFQRLVHALSEDILRETTGEKGLFFSRVLMVCRDLKRRKSPPKEIYVVDPDGRNLTPLTSDNTLSLSPSWAPDGKHILYTQFEFRASRGIRKKGTVLKMHNLMNGQRKILSSKDGMNSGAAWSPDGKRIAVTLSFSGRPEIYFIDPTNPGEPEPLSRAIQWKRVGGGGFHQNTFSLLFDVEPSWAPDGKKLVISSARTGHPMIYIVDLATKVATQLTFAGQYNASPAWSSKGDKIMFAAQQLAEGNFDLYQIDTDGSNLGRVTMGEKLNARRRANSENPSWAPTGRHIAYGSNETGHYAIYVGTADGAIKRRISPPDKECTTPSWGPFEG